MKKLFILVLFTTVTMGAMAQTEAGKMRLGGSTNLSFLNTKHAGYDDAMSEFEINANAGYFIIDKLSLDLGLQFGYEKEGDYDADKAFLGEIGARYYLPGNFFLGASFDILSIKSGDDTAYTGTGANLKAGYAWFVKDNIAIEPAVGYRIGLTNEDDGTKFDQFSIKLGISVFF